MVTCETCGESFDKWQQKANHVRWKHKEQKFSEEGILRRAQKIAESNFRRKGYTEKAMSIEEDRICPNCNLAFKVIVTINRKSFSKSYCSRACANRRTHSDETKKRISEGEKLAHADPVKGPRLREAWLASRRCSSKPERELAKLLGDEYSRQHNTKLDSGRLVAVDIRHKTKNVWVESDGPFHFQKMYGTHDFEASKTRDIEQNEHCEKNGILLVRLKNFAFTIDEQLRFVTDQVNRWDGTGKVVCLY